MSINFDNRVVLVTGSGRGLGRQYALQFAERGAKVVVNDLPGSATDSGQESAADQVVEEVRSRGGEAIANYDSVVEGERIIEATMDTFGRVDIVVNNAGNLRDMSFRKMTDEDWNIVHRVHTLGTFKVSHAAWPRMSAQKYGRIVNVTSTAIYGNFGQANYASAKCGLIGFTRTLAAEGAKSGIQANVIAPLAWSRMMETVAPAELGKALKPEFIAALVLKLSSEQNNESGSLFELGGGWISKVRFQRSRGVLLDQAAAGDPDAIADVWDQITCFDEYDTPESPISSMTRIMEAVGYNMSNLDLSKGVNIELAARRGDNANTVD